MTNTAAFIKQGFNAQTQDKLILRQYTLSNLTSFFYFPMTKSIPFEKSMAELEEIVMQLEKGDLSLENALKQFEKGINLARSCQEALNQAEQKIEMLAASNSITSERSDD